MVGKVGKVFLYGGVRADKIEILRDKLRWLRLPLPMVLNHVWNVLRHLT